MSFLQELHKPDILDCISHLSSDEVFTPPRVVNEMLDTLPQELFKSPDTKFLDPCSKSGVFLREIAKRLIDGLADKIPDLEKRLDHIFKNQLFGLAITELTALLSRRSVYCSKDASGEYSVVHFDNPEGNIEYNRTYHIWFKDKCMMCGASKSEYDRGEELETHAYSFIHTDEQRNSALFKRLKEMKFDVIIGNPPYQLQVNEAGKGLGAIPLYHKFVEQAIKLNPRYITMIIPARWFSGGVGLNKFREEMLNCKKIKVITDYIDSKDCFPGVDINGGVCYFLWDEHYDGPCDFKSNVKGITSISKRTLNEFPIFIRRNEAVSIIHKILSKNEKKLSDKGGCSSQTPFGFLSTFQGTETKSSSDDCEILSSKGWGYVTRTSVTKGVEMIDKYKTMISKLSSEHAGVPDKNGMYRVLSRMEILKPGQICNQSYLTVCASSNEKYAQNVFIYLRTRFVRFLLLQTLVGMNISTNNFQFVPWQNFDTEWTDEKQYKKYELTQEEIDFIESLIKPIE